MLKLYNKEHEAVAALTNLKDYRIEYILSGEDLLEFSLSRYDENINEVVEEGYIRTKFNEYVIKAIDPTDNFKRYSCVVNVESIKGKSIVNFDTSNNNITDTIRLAIAGTGWILADNNISKRRTVRLKNTNALEVLREIRKVFRIDYRFDAINKIIYVYEKLGSDKGAYFTDELNLISLDVPSDSYDYVTRLYCYGKDGLNISSVNDGKEYIENFQYSNKIIELIWEDNRYTDASILKEDAELKLEELSKPKRNYNVQVYDLAKNNSEFSFLDFSIGDTVTIISNLEKFRDKQRIVKYIEYPDEPYKNTCELGNTTLTFEELQKENEYKNKVVDNITSDNGTLDGSKVDSIKTEQISDFKTSVAEITDLTAINIKVSNLEAQNVTITGKLNAIEGEFGTIKANVGVIDKLTVNHTAQINALEANKASITQLEAVSAIIGTVEAEVGKIQTLVNGNLSSENMQAGGITGDKLNMNTIFVTDANMVNVNVSALKAGDISTNKFRIVSDSGKMLISDNTIQIKDNTRVRVQIGKDASNDYNMYVWDSTGKLMFDATGLKADGIKNKIIRDDMISDNANIGGSKINISSLINEVNKDTNTSTIKSSKVNIDLLNQTLDIAFNSLKTQADDTKSLTESHSTTIGVMQGEIKTAINNTQIIKDGQTILLKDDYNRTIQTVNSMNSTIGSHTTQINEHTGKITGVETRVNTVERDLNSITARVSSTEKNVTTVTTTANNALANANNANNKIDNLQIGGRNLLLNSDKYFESTTHMSSMLIGRLVDPEYILGKSIVVSCDFDVEGLQTGQRVGYEISLTFTDKTTQYLGCWMRYNINGSSYKGRMAFQFNVPNKELLSVGGSACHVQGTVTKCKLGRPMIEIGTKASDWDKAPEDTQSQIDTNKTEISTTKNKVSTIETNLTGITSRVSSVEQTQTSINGKVTALETWKKQAEVKITDASIISTVSSQFYKKGETDAKYASQTQISQLSTQINLKVDANGVKSLIQQNPESVKIGFNGIDARIKMTNDGLFLMSDSGKKRLGLRRASLYAYNYNTNEFLGGWSPRISQDNTVKGLGVIASKNADFYGIAYSPNWTNEEDDNPVGATSLMSINFKDRGTSIDLLKGIQFYDHVFIGGNLNMRNFNIRSVTGITCYGIYGTAWHTNEASPRLVFSIDDGTLKLNNSLNGNGNRIYGFNKITSTSNYVKNWYANHTNEKLMMHNDGYSMFADCGWDYQNNTLYRAKLIGSTYGVEIVNNNVETTKRVSSGSIIDEIEVVENLARTGDQLIIDISNVADKEQILLDNNNLAIEKLLPFLLKEIKDLKEEIRLLRAS